MSLHYSLLPSVSFGCTTWQLVKKMPGFKNDTLIKDPAF